jgi:membrane protein YdbS with pleckstrin-like domain
MGINVNVPAPGGPERELWQGTPSAKALLGALVAAGLHAAGVIAGVYLVYGPLLSRAADASPDVAHFVATNEGGLRLAAIAFVLTVVGLRLFRLAWRVAVLKSHRYRITSQRILIESGVLSKQIEEIDMRTVEDLQFRQSLVERLLGIGDITIISSDRSNARTRLVGLARPRELRELIRSSAYQATHGQLFTRQT